MKRMVRTLGRAWRVLAIASGVAAFAAVFVLVRSFLDCAASAACAATVSGVVATFACHAFGCRVVSDASLPNIHGCFSGPDHNPAP